MWVKGTATDFKTEGDVIVLFENANKSKLSQSPDGDLVPVSGTVKDGNGELLPGVTVLIKGTTIGTVTDGDGKFNLLNVPNEAMLVFSFVGMQSQEVAVAKKRVVNVVMKNDAIGLDEVVAVGYGTQKKVDLTGAVASVKAGDLNIESSTNVMNALQGRMAGVDVVSQGGEPGSGLKVMVRGVGTFNNNNPLYIVDGMYMDDIDFLNPNDIESVDVLKDASSAAIYGSRAANGVIIVTTKSGGDTEGLATINVSANIGIHQIPNKINVLNAEEWIEISTLAREAAGMNPLDMALNPQDDVDWQDEMMRLGVMQNYNVSAQGGTKRFKYFLGTGFLNQQGTIEGTGYKRANIQLKTEIVKGKFTIGENILVSYDVNNPIDRFTNRAGGVIGAMLNTIPTYTIYDDSSDGGYNGPWGDVINWPNPMGIMNLQDQESQSNKTYANTYVIFDFSHNFSYKLNANTDFWGNHSSNYLPHYEMGQASSAYNTLTESRGSTQNLMIENLLTYENKIEKNKIKILGGYSIQNRRYRTMTATGSYMPDGIKVVGAASVTSGGSQETVNVLESMFGRIFYSYDDRYLINATLRRDGSSKFPKDNRYGVFPSVSIGWNMHNESFIKQYAFVDIFKLRFGYGVLGNQEVGNYLYTSDVTGNINYVIDGATISSGAFPKQFASPDIKWESTKMTNIGLDLALFKNRLRASFEYYVKNTTDILLNVPIPISTGAANDPLVNAGEIRNEGIEMSLGINGKVNSDLKYSVNLLASAFENKVQKMGSGGQVIWSGKPNQSGGVTTKSFEGYPIGGFWLIETDGLFKSEEEVLAHSKDGKLIQSNAKPGDIRFKDKDNDGKIDDDDRVYKGSAFPDINLGMSGSLQWKDFDLSFSLQGSFGAKIYNSMRADLEDVSKGVNYSSKVLDYWSESNPNASFPRLIWGDPNQNARTSSDRFLESGSYFRITNLQFGYNIPVSVFPYFTSAKVYANIDNLCTVTQYSGFTPDVNSSSVLQGGVDKYTYPLPRKFTLGINVTF